jgi:hypothetical protein
MRRFTRRIALAAAFGMARLAARQSDPIQYTNGDQNGRWWKSIPNSQVYAVIGMMIGVDMCLQFLGNPVKKDGIESASNNLRTSKFTYGEICDKITRLYGSDPGNPIIPLSDMYQMALLGLRGDSPESIDKLLLGVRTYYANQR